MDGDKHRAGVAEYYGEILQSFADLRTSACCPVDAVSPSHRAILDKLHPEVLSRFYGCGSPVPSAIWGATVLDLGSGTGRDAYLASALVGPEGRVIGIDMTDQQLKIAEKYKEYHANVLLGDGVPSNVEFRKGIIEDLAAADVRDESVDVVISNCVCNLCSDKKQVWREVSRVLKQGGEFYFADVYADRRLSAEAACDEVLIGECLGGALYIEDFRRIMAEVGFFDVRVASCAPVVVNDPELLSLVPDVTFYSITVRAFKIPAMEDRRENYGQLATYNSKCGKLTLDVDFSFPAGVPIAVDSNTAAILRDSRYSRLFTVSKGGPHSGLFALQTEGGALESMIRKGLNADICKQAPAADEIAKKPASSNSCAPDEGPLTNSSACCGPGK